MYVCLSFYLLPVFSVQIDAAPSLDALWEQARRLSEAGVRRMSGKFIVVIWIVCFLHSMCIQYYCFQYSQALTFY